MVIGDGAEWISNNADRRFPGAVQTVDLYHARQHLWNIAKLLHPGDSSRRMRWILRHQPKLDGGKIETLVQLLRGMDPASSSIGETIRIEAAYFGRNAGLVRYPEFRRQHLFIGSKSKCVIRSRNVLLTGTCWGVGRTNS